MHVLEELNTSISHPRYHYDTKAKLISFAEHPNLVFACWSELAKHKPEKYGSVSPWQDLSPKAIEDVTKNNLVFDLYHGTIAGAKDMGNNHDLHADGVQFYGDIVALGHIHKYQRIGNAFYSSSLVPRAFNEGLRWNSSGVVYDYLNEHGYIVYDINGTQIDHRFIPIYVSVKPITMVLDDNATLDMVKHFTNQYAHDKVIFKLVLNYPRPEVLSYLYDAVQRQSNWRIAKVESVNLAKHAKAITETTDGEVVKRIDLTFEEFEPVIRKLVSEKTDNPDLQNYVVNIAKQECGYHLHPSPMYTSEITDVEIHNFLTIKNIAIQLTTDEIVRLFANNRVGKTSVLKGILFGITGLTYAGVNKAALKQYHLSLFNDKMPESDVAIVNIGVTVNNVRYIIKQTLTKVRNNERHVVKVVHDTQILDVAENIVILNGPDCFPWLQSIFGDFDTFNLMHFMSVDNLSYLKTLKPEYLVNLMLSRLGYDAILKLQHFVNGAKFTEFEKFPKTSKFSSIQLQADIEGTEFDLQTDIANRDIYQANVDNGNTRAEELVKERIALHTKNANLANFPQYILDRDQAAYNLQFLSNKPEVVTKLAEKLGNLDIVKPIYLAEFSRLDALHNDFKQKVTDYNGALELHNVAVNAYDKEVLALNSLEDNLASQVSQVLTEKKGTFEALINAIDTKPLETEIETLGKSIATYTTEKATQQRSLSIE
jgi:hypothetical protein